MYVVSVLAIHTSKSSNVRKQNADVFISLNIKVVKLMGLKCSTFFLLLLHVLYHFACDKVG